MINNSNQGQIKHEELQQAMKNLDSIIQSWNFDMTKRENEFQQLKTVAIKYEFGEGEIIKLNIGGKKFNVMKETLSQKLIRMDYDSEEDGDDDEKKYYPPHMFTVLVSGIHNLTKDESDYIFIDRDGRFFPYVLNYLRSGGFLNSFVLPSDRHILECLYIESRFYNLQGLVELIESSVKGIASMYPETNQTKRKRFDSKILSEYQSKKLYNEILDGVEKGIPKLLFRASDNGTTGPEFHSKCDGKGRTVTILKATSGAIFGGYAGPSWNSNSSYCFDNSCFIFSLVSASGEERYVKLKNDGVHHSNTYSIYCNPNQGPSFGGGHDIYISNNSKSQENYTNLGHSFSLPGFTYGSANIKSYLAGTYNFSVEDYEVFALQ